MMSSHRLMAGALLLGLLADILFFHRAPGVSVLLMSVATAGVLTWYAHQSKRPFGQFEWALIGTIVVFSAFFLLRTSPWLLVLDGVVMGYLFLLLMARLYGAPTGMYRLIDMVAFPLLDVLMGFASSLGILKQVKPVGARSVQVVRGVVLGGALAIVFLALFAAADPVFAELLTRLISPEVLRELIARLVDVVLVGVFVLLVCAPAFWRKAPVRSLEEPARRFAFGTESAIVLGVSNALFALFLVVRGSFLFGGETRLEQFDLTYAEYARHGFFQLLIVALIVLGITWLMRLVRHEHTHMANQVLQITLLVQTMAIVASSWMALAAYEQAFGFTQLRLFSHAFLLVVIGLLIVMLVGILHTRVRATTLLYAGLCLFVVGAFGLNLLNPDAFIARKNIARWAEGENLDYHLLLVDLSLDAAPAILSHFAQYPVERWEEDSMILPWELHVEDRSVDYGYNMTVRNAYTTWYTRTADHLADTHWQSWNISRAWARAHITPSVN